MLDFPNTPAVGQIVWAPSGAVFVWDGRKWTNNNSSPPPPQGTAPYLPLAGGVMAGPLSYTATGGNTTRAAQDRAAETLSVRDFGAACDGTTNDTAAFNAAFASGAKVVTVPPNVTCWLPGGITVPGGVHLRGTTFQANNMVHGTAPNSTILTGPNVNCVTLMDDGDGAVHGSTLSDLAIVTNNVAKPTTGAGIYVHAGYNVRIEHVVVSNCYDGFYFLATPTAGGISGFINNCGSGRIAGHHVVMDSWPELRIISSRFGANGGPEWVALAYCYVTGGSPNDSIVPNGLLCTDCQFNEAGGGPSFAVGALLLIGGLTNNAAPNEFSFINCHAEAVATYVKTDATVTALNYLSMTGCHLVYQQANFFALNAATNIINGMVLSGNFTDVATFALSNTLFNDCVISGNSISTPNLTLGSTSNSSLAFTGNAILGNLTFSGNWQSLWAGGGSLRGTLTNTATGTTRIDIPGSALVCSSVAVPTQGGITATGTTSAGAYALTAPYSSVTVAAAHGVRLPSAAAAGSRWTIFNNDGGSAVNVYPPTGHAFYGLGADIAISVAASTKLIVIYFGGNAWLREA